VRAREPQRFVRRSLGRRAKHRPWLLRKRLEAALVAQPQALRVKRKGRNLRPGEVGRWSREYFWALGLYQLRGTICYPERAFFKEAA